VKQSVRRKKGDSGNLEVFSTRRDETRRRVLTYDGHGRRLELKQGHEQRREDIRESARGRCLISDSVPLPNQVSVLSRPPL
jgi:hypothetical protein